MMMMMMMMMTTMMIEIMIMTKAMPTVVLLHVYAISPAKLHVIC